MPVWLDACRGTKRIWPRFEPNVSQSRVILVTAWVNKIKVQLFSWLYKNYLTKCNAVYFGRYVESCWNVMAHGDARVGKWRGIWRMEWTASTLHVTSEHGVPSITTADAHTSAASSRLKWRPRRYKWTRPFRRKTKSGFCACTITFQMHCTTTLDILTVLLLYRRDRDSHRGPSTDRRVISFTSKPFQVSGLPPCLAVNRSANLITALVLPPSPNYFYLIWCFFDRAS